VTTILACDVGTSGVKVVLTDSLGSVIAARQESYGLIAGPGGWVDQDLDAILAALYSAGRALVEGLEPSSIDAVAVTAQMFNLVPLDGAGRPLTPMLSWLDQRAAGQAVRLAERLDRAAQFERFGSIVTAKDVVPKIEWLREERPDIWAQTAALVDCKEAVVAALTGEVVIDPAGAMAFRLFDPRVGAWSPAACEAIGVPVDLLPAVRPATSIAGGLRPEAAEAMGLPSGLPVVVGAGDVPASQVGAGATRPGDAHVSLGTAVYFGVTVDRPVEDPAGQLGVLGHIDPDRWILWLEVATGGGALNWLLRVLDADDADDPGAGTLARIDALVGEASAMDGLLFAPWLSGERVPVFDDRLRGAFVGLGLHHGRSHLLRAVMEGVAYQMRWALEYGADYGVPIDEIRGVGGGAIGSAWTQIIADVLGRPVLSMAAPQDATARGAATCAIIGLGLQPDTAFARETAVIERVHRPSPEAMAAATDAYGHYRRLYEALRPVYEDHAAWRAGMAAPTAPTAASTPATISA
jgi:xylulokinase